MTQHLRILVIKLDHVRSTLCRGMCQALVLCLAALVDQREHPVGAAETLQSLQPRKLHSHYNIYSAYMNIYSVMRANDSTTRHCVRACTCT